MSETVPKLTPRERQVVRLLAEGFTHEAIALNLGIAKNTVDIHTAAIWNKSGGGNVVSVLRKFYEFIERPSDGSLVQKVE